MQIFLLHEDPDEAATALSDKHVNKMCLEAVQIANTGLHLAGAGEYAFYGATHKSHPWCEFAAESFDHFQFVVRHAQALGREFLRRYDGRHTSHDKLRHNWTHDVLTEIANDLGRAGDRDSVIEDAPQAMLDQYKQDDPIEAYRAYYYGEKMPQNWFTYRKADPPEWFVAGTPRSRWQ